MLRNHADSFMHGLQVVAEKGRMVWILQDYCFCLELMPSWTSGNNSKSLLKCSAGCNTCRMFWQIFTKAFFHLLEVLEILMSNSVNVLLFLVSCSTCPCYPLLCLLLVIGIDIACRWFCGWRTLWYLFPVITQVLLFVWALASMCLLEKSFKLAFSVGCNEPDWHF